MQKLGDLNGDGQVTNADLQGLITLLANGGGSGSLTAVPEPTSSVLMALAGVIILSAVRLGARGLRHEVH
jgi:hypothetical protein